MSRLHAIVLALSLAGNVFIATRLLAATTARTPPATDAPPPTAAALLRPAMGTPRPVPRLADPACERLARLRSEVGRIEAGLRMVESAARQYEASAQTAPELERELRNQVGLAPAIAVSCKTRVCRVEVVGDGGVDMHLVDQIEGNDWVRRHLRSVSLGRSGFFVSMRDEDEAFGTDVLLQVVRQFYASGAIERCSLTPGAPAEVAARLRLVPGDDLHNASDRTAITIELHGVAADSAFGRCLYEGLVEASDRELPERVSSAVFENVGLWPPEKQERYRRLSLGK